MASTYGDAISLDMGDGSSVSTSETLGPINGGYANWQYFSGESGTAIEDVEDDSGTVQTGCDITPANDAGSRNGNSSGSGAVYDMYARGLVIANSGNTTLSAVGVPYSKYDVVICVDEHAFSNGGVTTSYSDGTTTYYSDIQGSSTALYSGSWTRITDTSGSGGTGNYILFEGLTSSSFTITMNSDGFSGTQISGMQIIERTDGSGTTASGTPSLPSATGDGAATVGRSASGTPSLPAATGDGAAQVGRSASGTPSLAAVTASGAAVAGKVASGTPSLPAITADGAATVAAGSGETASGTPVLPATTGDGAAQVGRNAAGTPSLAAATGDGAATVGRSASGTPALAAITADGAAQVGTARTASGTPSLPAITASGAAQVGEVIVIEDTHDGGEKPVNYGKRRKKRLKRIEEIWNRVHGIETVSEAQEVRKEVEDQKQEVAARLEEQRRVQTETAERRALEQRLAVVQEILREISEKIEAVRVRDEEDAVLALLMVA